MEKGKYNILILNFIILYKEIDRILKGKDLSNLLDPTYEGAIKAQVQDLNDKFLEVAEKVKEYMEKEIQEYAERAEDKTSIYASFYETFKSQTEYTYRLVLKNIQEAKDIKYILSGEVFQDATKIMKEIEKAKAPIKKLSIDITKDGTRIKINRQGHDEYQLGTKFDELMDKSIEEKINQQLLEDAYAKGDTYIIREILAQINAIDGIDQELLKDEYAKDEEVAIRAALVKLHVREKEEQLAKYVKVLAGEYTEELPFEINYYLKDIRKAGLSKEERETLIANAKKIRDLNKMTGFKIGTVEAMSLT